MRRLEVRREPGRPVAWSMDLLTQLWEHPVDPEYAAVAREARPHGSRRRLPLAAVALVLGALVALQAAQTVKAAPDLETERQQLIERVRAADRANEALRADQQATEKDISRLQAQLGDEATQQRIAALAPGVGQQAVQGPGITVVVDDADGGTGAGSRVTDVDLRQLVNGLWQAGAEAVAINGHRLSARTAIRSAGAAITVDYTSLLRPYRVDVIGDPRTLEARFAQTAGGAWWADAKGNYGLRYEVQGARSLRLEADPGLTVTRATVEGGR